jgi:hypothetical protein
MAVIDADIRDPQNLRMGIDAKTRAGLAVIQARQGST